MGGWIRGALDLQIWGAPFLPSICTKTLVLKGFGENRGQKWGAPNSQIQRPTDPTPHLKPSECSAVPLLRRCPSTVPCTVLSGESPNFRWIPSCQRVLSGGLDPWGVGSAHLGRSILPQIFPKPL